MYEHYNVRLEDNSICVSVDCTNCTGYVLYLS